MSTKSTKSKKSSTVETTRHDDKCVCRYRLIKLEKALVLQFLYMREDLRANVNYLSTMGQVRSNYEPELSEEDDKLLVYLPGHDKKKDLRPAVAAFSSNADRDKRHDNIIALMAEWGRSVARAGTETSGSGLYEV